MLLTERTTHTRTTHGKTHTRRLVGLRAEKRIGLLAMIIAVQTAVAGRLAAQTRTTR